MSGGQPVHSVLIAGCGDVGCRLGMLLAARGVRVYGLRRNTSALPEGIEPVAADLADPRSLHALPPAQVVVYAAAAAAHDAAAYEAAYVTGVRNLLAALDRAALIRAVYCSSTGVYGQDDGSWVDEDSPAEAEAFNGRLVRAGERVFEAADVPTTAVRFGGIYGPGRTRLIDGVRAGTLRPRGGPPHYTNRIHADDCAGVLAHVLSLEAPPPVLVAVDDEPAPLDDVLEFLAARLGVEGGGLTPPPDPGAAPTGKRCRNARLRTSGYALRYPTYREGYGAALDDECSSKRPPRHGPSR